MVQVSDNEVTHSMHGLTSVQYCGVQDAMVCWSCFKIVSPAVISFLATFNGSVDLNAWSSWK